MADLTPADQFVRLERRDDGVAIITLDRPKVNALSIALLRELKDLLDVLAKDLPGCVIITGGETIFAAGAEIKELPVGGDSSELAGAFRETLGTLAALPRFVIAAINGVALGGGLELALACDWRIAAHDSRLGLPETQLGVIPGGGGTQRLARLVGPARAKELAITGRNMSAEEALRIGLVDEVHASGDVQERALVKAVRVASGAVQAHAAVKAAVDEGFETTLAWGLDLEADLFQQVLQTEDARIGVDSFVANGPGKAVFTGR
jgi:enoyl-CoA hydratase/carnithine racemase